MADGNDPDATIERELQQAQQALDDATKARAAGLSDAAVINRLYYTTLRFMPSRRSSTIGGSTPRLAVPCSRCSDPRSSPLK